MPGITFAHIRPIPISVGALRTNSDAESITESFIVSPHEVMEKYLQSRFMPKGFSGTLQAVIEEAQVNHSYEGSGSKVGSFLDVGGLDVYDMSIRVRLEYVGADDQLIQGSVLSARRIMKVSEHASIAERERRQFMGIEAMFGDLDEQVKQIVLKDMQLGI